MLKQQVIPSSRALNDAETAENKIDAYQTLIQEKDRALEEAFQQGQEIESLVYLRAQIVDTIITHLWKHDFNTLTDKLSLIAVGGYGRGELHPHSDIDIMILVNNGEVDRYKNEIAAYIRMLWDIGFKLGHSVRTFAEAVNAAKADISIVTNIMEARWLAGNQSFFKRLQNAINEDTIWPIAEFYQAKLAEQENRYKKFDDLAYRLEPNIKNGPGGLRDIQNIAWVAMRYYGARTLQEVAQLDFLTAEENQDLIQGRAYLWKIRWGLHTLSKRDENRLLFDLQRQLANLLGYQGNPDQHTLDVEQFMQDYYRTVIRLERLNEMLLQILRDAIFQADHKEIVIINSRFCVDKGYLAAREDDIFTSHPSALLEVFQLMQQHPHLKGVSAKTIRLIRQSRDCIDDAFRHDKKNQAIFLSLLKHPTGITREFRRMNRYGILARYLPNFANIVGKMQFDLYHIYTVDQHTIAVLGYTRIFTVAAGKKRFPKLIRIFKQLDKPELLYIAALFHDIGKGRGGDHSKLGAVDAKLFCQMHDLPPTDTHLVCWLVENHLLMSLTAQRKDLSDNQVIADFAKKVTKPHYLDYLYLLTVADINGTNPALWTSWKESLLHELYVLTHKAFHYNSHDEDTPQQQMQRRQRKALEILEYSGLNEATLHNIWEDFPEDYFLRHASDEIAWQAQAIARAQSLPLILIQERAKRGGTTIFIYGHKRRDFFSHAAITMDRIKLNVVDARISSTNSGKVLNTFIVLDYNNQPVESEDRKKQIIEALQTTLLNPDEMPVATAQDIPRQLKPFNIATTIEISSSADNKHTQVEVTTGDRPGILAHIGQAFIASDIYVHNAKINTLGERVDDIFFITDTDNAPLSDPEQIKMLTEQLYRFVDADRETTAEKTR